MKSYLKNASVRSFFIIAFAVAISGCETLPPPSVANVGFEYDSRFNFDAVATFAIVRPESPSPISPILRKNILNETAARLGRMGYKEVEDPKDADILVSAHGTSRRVVDSITYSNVYYTNTYRRSSWIYVGGYPSTYITTREEGTLIIDIVDAENRELVWRGWGIRKFTVASEVSREQIQESVRRLLANFPPSS